MLPRCLVLLLAMASAAAAEMAFQSLRQFGGSADDSIVATLLDRDGNIVIVGTTTSSDLPGERITRIGSERSLLRSEDGGATWTPVDADRHGVFHCFASNASRPRVVLACGHDGIYRSTDGGRTWSKTAVTFPVGFEADSAAALAEAIEPAPGDPEVFYAISQYGLMKSTNAGQTWSLLTKPGTMYPFAIAVSPADANTLLLTRLDPDAGFWLARSTDGGGSWKSTFYPGYYLSPVFDHRQPGLAYLRSGRSIQVSTDAGATWGARLPSPPYVSPDRGRTGSLIGVDSDGTFQRSDDRGATWQTIGSLGTTLTLGTEVTSLTQSLADPLSWFAVTEADNRLARSADGGRTWTIVDSIAPNKVHASGENGAALVSINLRSNIFVSRLTPDASRVLSTTLIGGRDRDEARAARLDSAGNIVVLGRTFSPDFPVLPGAPQPQLAGVADAVLFHLSADGGRLLHSTYFGGKFDEDPLALAVDHSGNVYAAGTTMSPDFPTTPGAFRPSATTYIEGFVLKTDPGGIVAYSTYLGPLSRANAVVADRDGSVWVTGSSSSPEFPVTADAIQPDLRTIVSVSRMPNAVVLSLTPDGSALSYSTFYGGSFSESGTAIALDDSGNVYVAGGTRSRDFPTTTGAYWSAYRALSCVSNVLTSQDGFVLKLTPHRQLAFSTLTGGACTLTLREIQVASGTIWLAGDTAPWPIDGTQYPFTFGLSNHWGRVFEMDLQGTHLRSGPALPGNYPSLAIDERGKTAIVGTGALIVPGFQRLGPAYGSSHVAQLTFDSVSSPLGVRSIESFADANTELIAGDLAKVSVTGLEGVPEIDLGINAGRDLPTELGAVRLLFDGVAAPILSVREGAIVCVIPSSVRAGYGFVELEFRGRRSLRRMTRFLPPSPARWKPLQREWLGFGRQLLARNQDGTLNDAGNPARRGSIVTLYVTGAGPTNPKVADGSVAGPQPVRPLWGSVFRRTSWTEPLKMRQPWEVLDISTMPGFVAALFQVRVRVPEDAEISRGTTTTNYGVLYVE